MQKFFDQAKLEDENIRTDLGFGGMFMNFIVSPGQDTALYDRGLNEFIAGYAHLYSYDFEMLKTLLERTGFYCVEQKGFCESEIDDYREPLHVTGMDPIWRNFNQKFYKENNLVHYYDSVEGKYNINFKVTGFDRDPLTSLIIEARKKETIDLKKYESLNDSKQNYNKYALIVNKIGTANYLAMSNFEIFGREIINDKLINIDISSDPVITPTVPINILDDNYKYIVFQNTGNNQTSYSITFSQNTTCDILIIGGGGSGGKSMSANRGGGGGGAGGLIYITSTILPADTYTLNVGNGGLGSSSGQNGYDSSIVSTSINYIAYGGGGGGNVRDMYK